MARQILDLNGLQRVRVECTDMGDHYDPESKAVRLARDKYDRRTDLPVHPTGFAKPDKNPLYPQDQAEIMGGRIPISPNQASIPRSLVQTVIGPTTASEIGW